jgi:hypothetical protein
LKILLLDSPALNCSRRAIPRLAIANGFTRLRASATIEAYLCILTYAAPFYTGWTPLDMYRLDPEHFWERLVLRVRSLISSRG